MGLFGKKKKKDDDDDEVSRESKKKEKKKKKEEEDDEDEESDAKKKKRWWSWDKGKDKDKDKDKDKEKEKEKGKSKSPERDASKTKPSPKSKDDKKPALPPPPSTPLKGASQGPPRTPRTPAGVGGIADALAHLQSSRNKRGGSVPSTPLGKGSTPGSPSGIGRGTPLGQVLAGLKTTPTGRGRGGALNIANTPTSKGTGSGTGAGAVIAQALVSSAFKGKGTGSLPPTPTTAGRGRGKGLPLANTIATSFINTVLNSPSVSIAGANLSFSEAFTPGRTVFISASKPNEEKARGIIVEPQGDMVVVKPDPPWEHSHKQMPYDKARLRLLPPLRSVVEVKGHSNVKLNGRTGVVVDYDNNENPRPNAIRVSLHPTADEPASTILLNYLNLKKVHTAGSSGAGSLPTLPSPINDPVKKHFLTVSKGKGSATREQLITYLHSLPKDDTSLDSVSDVIKKLGEHSGETVTEGEWAALVASIRHTPRRASVMSATSVITQDEHAHDEAKSQPGDEKEEEENKEDQRAKEEEERVQKQEEEKQRLKEEEKRHKEEEERQKEEDKVDVLLESEGVKRGGLEDREGLKRENIVDKFTDRKTNIESALKQREQRDQILLLSKELDDLKKEKALSPPAPPLTPTPATLFTPHTPTTPTNNDDLWASFKAALSDHGAQIADINHATDDQLMNLMTENLGFSRLSAMRLVNLWHMKIQGAVKETPKTKKKAAEEPEKPKVDIKEPSLSDDAELTKPVDDETADKVKGKRVVLDKGSQEFVMVGEVLKHTTTCGDGSFEVCLWAGKQTLPQVRRVVQITPSQTLSARYNKARSRMGSTPKVLYYSGPSMPGIAEVMQSGFTSELRRNKVLQFSTEANIEAAMQGGAGETVMLLLCEVVAGRVHRVQPGSTAALYKHVVKYCGPPNPPKGVGYPADCIGVDYLYTDQGGEAKTATKYILTDPARVIPRYLVYLTVTMPPPAAGAAYNLPVVLTSPRSASSVATPTTHLTYNSAATPRREVPVVYQTPIRIGGLMGGRMNADMLVMCPLHPKQELCLYCVDDEELTCPKCASVGRHSGKRCQPLSELLQKMRGHLAVHERQVATQLAATEAGLGQLQRQAGSVRDAENRARRQIRQRTSELMEEVSSRRENLESELTYKVVDAGSRVQDAIKSKMDQAAMLREAHAKIQSLISLSHSNHGISAKASDIITLSKLLERLRNPHSTPQPPLTLPLNIAEDINFELSRMHLPPPSIAASPHPAVSPSPVR